MNALVSDISSASIRGEKHIHSILESLIRLNTFIDNEFNVGTVSDIELKNSIETIQDIILQRFNDFSELHRVRNNIVASVGSTLFVTETRLRLLAHDEEWCNLDSYYRENHEFFYKQPVCVQDHFQQNNLTYFNVHPLAQYTMSQCKTNLQEILLSKINYNSNNISFIKILFEQIRDRICILMNYPYSEETNDMSQYVVKIGNNRAICTSAFVYDFHIYIYSIQNNLELFKYLDKDEYKNTDSFHTFFKELGNTFLVWLSKMVITAAGDDFADIFSKFYVKFQVKDFEIAHYKRVYPGVNIIPYKLLQHTRGMEIANKCLLFGNDFIVNLLKKDESDDDPDSIQNMCTYEQVIERLEEYSQENIDILYFAVIDYVTEREWGRSIMTLFINTFQDLSTLEPSLMVVPFTTSYAVLKKTDSSKDIFVFDSFHKAFCAWAYFLQKDFDGVLYMQDTKQKINCTPLLQKMLS